MIGTAIITWFLHLLILLFVFRLASNYWRLRHIPGPALAACTDFWRLFLVWGRESEKTYIELHKRYGDVVRIGPNCVSVSGPDNDVTRSIYGFGKGFIKSDFYHPIQNIVNRRRVASLVAMTDEAQHAATRRPVAPAYSLSTLLEYEPLVDSTTTVFFSRLDELFANSQSICNLGQWLQFYAFDVIGELTFSKRLGFLEQAKDVEGIMHSIAANFDRTSILGQMPFLDLCWAKNLIYTTFFAKPTPSSPIISFGQRRLLERLNAVDQAEVAEKSKPDFLSRFLAVCEGEPDMISDQQLLGYLFMNINAGSDTVAVTTRAIVNYLLKNQSTLSKLRSALEHPRSSNKLSLPLPTWTETKSIPYLTAVIKEALRLHPALGLPLERVVPASGLQLQDSKHTIVPPSTVVGVKPFVLHHDKRIFGKDAEDWNPDRWLDQDEARVKLMEHNLLSFGGGNRTCLGRSIAMLEMHKLVPALVMRYDMRLAEPDKGWRTTNSWTVRQEGLEVVLTRRDEIGAR